jgi:phosphoglycolate phosphatase
MKEVNLVITDLDDTIWDWLQMWYNSFYPYLERIAKETGIEKDLLINDFKNLHQKYGTTEMSFAFKELPTIDKKFYPLFEETLDKNKKNILHEYYSNKKNNLKNFSGVVDTLKKIKSKGSLVIAFTESYVFFTKYRIKHLNLDGLIDFIYSPLGSDVPESVYRHYSEDFWEPIKTKIRSLPNSTRKPDAEILNQIVDDFDADKSKAIYIGDKLDRDIYMAQQAGITSVYAKYGHVIENSAYDLLRKVTHWSADDVKREIEFKNQKLDIKPADYTLDDFNSLLTFFDFKPFNN